MISVICIWISVMIIQVTEKYSNSNVLGGHKERWRRCREPRHGGKSCSGSKVQYSGCNLGKCKLECMINTNMVKMYPEQVLYQQYNAEVMEKDGKASSNMTTAVTTLRPLTTIPQDQDFTPRRLVSTLFFSLLQSRTIRASGFN